MLGKAAGNNEATLIATGAVVSGDIEFEGELIIGGEVRGNIAGREGAQSLLTVGKGGTVIGEVRVPKIEVHGTVQGDVHSDGNLRLAPTGRVIGDVYYEIMEMQQGAEVNGRLLRAKAGGRRADDGKSDAEESGKNSRSSRTSETPAIAAATGGTS